MFLIATVEGVVVGSTQRSLSSSPDRCETRRSCVVKGYAPPDRGWELRSLAWRASRGNHLWPAGAAGPLGSIACFRPELVAGKVGELGRLLVLVWSSSVHSWKTPTRQTA